MDKLKEAQDILKSLGLPAAQQNDMSAWTLLALCGIEEKDNWSNSSRHSVTVSKGIMNFVAKKYKRKYAPNTRETFRRQVLHYFLQAGVVGLNPDNPGLPTNSPNVHYALTQDALDVIRNYGTKRWRMAIANFRKNQTALVDIYENKRKFRLVPVRLPDGENVMLSPGEHNILQSLVIEKFAPRFVPGGKRLYLGDTSKKNLFVAKSDLAKLGVPVTDHDKLPDIVMLDEKRNRLVLVEVVTSHGPMNPKRVLEIGKVLTGCPLELVYVSAFPNFTEFKRHLKDIAWETEVWISEFPDHMIHYNGDKFL